MQNTDKQFKPTSLGYLQSLQLNFCNIIDKTTFLSVCVESINKKLANTVNSKVTFTNSVITRYLLALKGEQRGVSVSFYEVQEHPSFPDTKIFTLCAFQRGGGRVNKFVVEPFTYIPMPDRMKSQKPCDWLPKMSSNQSQIRMVFLSGAWEEKLLGSCIV